MARKKILKTMIEIKQTPNHLFIYTTEQGSMSGLPAHP